MLDSKEGLSGLLRFIWLPTSTASQPPQTRLSLLALPVTPEQTLLVHDWCTKCFCCWSSLWWL